MLGVNKFCIMVDNARNNADQLKELFDYLKANKSRYEKYQYDFMEEHIEEAVENVCKKYCGYRKMFV